MSTLDHPNSGVDPSTVSFWPTALRYGVIGGLIMVVYGLVGNITGISKPSSGFGLVIANLFITIGLYVSILVVAIRGHRDGDLGGYISFGRAFIVGLVAAVIMGILSAIFQYVYITMIEPDFAATMVAEMEQMYLDMGLDEAQVDEAMKQVEGNFTATAMFTSGLLYSVGFGAFISLIVAAIMKKNPPEVA